MRGEPATVILRTHNQGESGSWFLWAKSICYWRETLKIAISADYDSG